MKKIITSAILDGYSPRKDGSFTLRFVTNEMQPSEVANIHNVLSSFGYLYFKGEEELTKEELKELDELDTDLYDNPKTKSQRLKNVLYKVWEQETPGNEFKDYYASKMEQLIQHFKDKLDD